MTKIEMTETTWREIQVTGADWTTVVRAFSPNYGQDTHGFGPGFSNVPVDWRARVYATMEESGRWVGEDADPEWYARATDTVILMAVEPAFGAVREFEVITYGQEDLDRTPLVSDDVFRGWWVLDEKHTEYIYAESGGSQSSITASRQWDNTWVIIGRFPVRFDGEVYEGIYYHTFHAAIK